MSDSRDRFLIKRGNLAGTGGAQAAPGSAATITIFDSTDPAANNPWPHGLPFERTTLTLVSSADSGADGVVHASSVDRGTNWDTQDTDTYATADGSTTWDYLIKGGHLRIRYTNSASVLTGWRYELWGHYDRNQGA